MFSGCVLLLISASTDSFAQASFSRREKIHLISTYCQHEDLAKKNAHFDMNVLLENSSVLEKSKSWAWYLLKNQMFAAGHETMVTVFSNHFFG